MRTLRLLIPLILLFSLFNNSLFANNDKEGNCEKIDVPTRSIHDGKSSAYDQSFIWKARNAADDRVIILGRPSKLGNAMGRGQDVKVKTDGFVSAVQTRNAKLENDMNTVVKESDVIVVDVAGIGGKLKENKYIQAALTHSIPIVLENAKSDEMSDLIGIGVPEADAVVITNYNDRNGAKIVVIDSGNRSEAPKLEEEATVPVTAQMKERIQRENIDLEARKRKNQDAFTEKTKKEAAAPLKFNVNAVAKSALKSAADSKEQAKKIRKNLPSGRDLRNSGLRSGRGPSVGEIHAPSLPVRTNMYTKEFAAPAVGGAYDFSRAVYDVTFDWSWDNRGQKMLQHFDLEVELIAAISPKYKKYVRVTPKNTSYFKPGTMIWNNEFDRGYYQDNCALEFTYLNANGTTYKLDNYAPLNTNPQTNYSHTTGFSIGADVGASPDGPSSGLSASYSESKTESTTVSDFVVNTTYSNKQAKFNFKMGKSWKDYEDICLFCKPRVKALPYLATTQLTPRCEVVFTAPGDFYGQKSIQLKSTQYGSNIWSNKDEWAAKWYYRSYGMSISSNFSVDFSKVNYPHMAIDKSTTISSQYSNWDKSRAIDGYTQGVNYFTGTNYQNKPYLDIDIGSSKYIFDIDIWNVPAYRYHLLDYHVFVSESPFTSTDPNVTKNQSGVSNYFHNGLSPRMKKFDTKRKGRYIRIQRITTGGWLIIGEVAVNPRRS